MPKGVRVRISQGVLIRNEGLTKMVFEWSPTPLLMGSIPTVRAMRNWCSGSTVVFQTISTGSNPVSRFVYGVPDVGARILSDTNLFDHAILGVKGTFF